MEECLFYDNGCKQSERLISDLKEPKQSETYQTLCSQEGRNCPFYSGLEEGLKEMRRVADCVLPGGLLE